MSAWLEKDLSEQLAALRARELKAVDLMDATLARHAATHETLNALFAVPSREALLDAAADADARLDRGDGRALEGIPLGVKDLEDVAGMPTTYGCAAYRDHVAASDGLQVARFRAAGAIPIGKTTVPEFGATAITKNRVQGVTRSPWNPAHSPGGSSGGSAALVAARVLSLATAEDGGGSIRIPSCWTGAFGIKPTYGRIPRGPLPDWNYGDTECLGPISRSVEDAAIYLDVAAGYDGRDPKSLPDAKGSYVEALRREPSERLRLAYSPDLGYAVVQPDIAATVENAVQAFEKLGHKIEVLEAPAEDLGRAWVIFGAFQMAAEQRETFAARPDDYSGMSAAGIRASAQLSVEHFAELKRARGRLCAWAADVFERYDALLTPTVAFDPCPAEGPFPSEVAGRKVAPWAVASFTIPFNMTQHPAASIRAGLSEAGFPVGLQIVGDRYREDRVLQLARAFEAARPWKGQWPTL